MCLKSKALEKYLIYKIKYKICDAIYIGNTQKTFKKILDGNFSDVQHILKNRQKSDSLAAQYKQYVKQNMSHNYLRNCMYLELLKELNLIGEMKSYTKTNFNICVEERLTFLKNICDKNVTLKKREYTGPSSTKQL